MNRPEIKATIEHLKTLRDDECNMDDWCDCISGHVSRRHGESPSMFWKDSGSSYLGLSGGQADEVFLMYCWPPHLIRDEPHRALMIERLEYLMETGE